MKRNNRAGFGLIELSIVFGILIAMAAVVVPARRAPGPDQVAGKMIHLIDQIRAACAQYQADTGEFAVEWSHGTTPELHRLGVTQSIAGWNGPYLPAPLGRDANPCGGVCQVYDSIEETNTPGFRLSGSDDPILDGPANVLYLTEVPEAVAVAVDAVLDNGITGDWATLGRVKYSAKGKMPKLLEVFLVGPAPK